MQARSRLPFTTSPVEPLLCLTQQAGAQLRMIDRTDCGDGSQ